MSSSRQTGNSVPCVRPSPCTKPIKNALAFEGIFSSLYNSSREFRNSLPWPKPSRASKNLETRGALAPLLLRWFLRFLFWLGFRLCFWLGLFGWLGGRLRSSFGCRCRRYGLFLGDEDLFFLGLHDFITAAQLVFFLQP